MFSAGMMTMEECPPPDTLWQFRQEHWNIEMGRPLALSVMALQSHVAVRSSSGMASGFMSAGLHAQLVGASGLASSAVTEKSTARGEPMALHPDYPLETERLRLRPFRRGDVDAVLEYRSREDVARYLFDPPLSREECAVAIQQRTTQFSLVGEGDRIILAVERREDNALVGEVSLIWRSQEGRQGELGWIFHPDHQGKGYATEATRCMLELGFGGADLHRLFARCDARNTSSWRLMERLGMRREAHFREHGVFKGGWDEEFYYAMLRREWLAMRQGEAAR